MKKEFPHLKVTAFTIAKFRDLASEDLNLSESFFDWYSNRTKWVEIALHGFTHGYPPEFLRWKEYQKSRILNAISHLKHFLPKHIGLRPPGSKFNEFTKQICMDLDLSYFAPIDRLITFKPLKVHKCNLINSHLSSNRIDSLDQIRKDLENMLKTSSCITLSELFA